MNGVPPMIDSSPESFFKQFQDAFPTPEDRLSYAKRLASPDGNISADSFQTRNLLCAHWGHPEDEVGELAEFLYSIKPELDGAIGQTVLAYRTKSADGRALDEEGVSIYPLVVESGILVGEPNKAKIDYMFGGRVSDSGTSPEGIEAPYVRFDVRLPVVDGRRVEVDICGEPTVSDTEVRSVSVYDGVLSLRYDPQVYDTNRHVVRRALAIGNAAAVNTLGDIVAVTPGEATLPRYVQLLRDGAVKPDAPLPDLERIFGHSYGAMTEGSL